MPNVTAPLSAEHLDDGVVPLTEKCLDDYIEIFIAAFNPEPWNEEWTPESARERLINHIRETPRCVGFMWLDPQSKRPCGFILGHEGVEGKKRIFNLKEVCVSPQRQGEGIGSQLLRRLEQEASRLGVVKITFSTRRGGPSEAFFVKHGYSEDFTVIKMLREIR